MFVSVERGSDGPYLDLPELVPALLPDEFLDKRREPVERLAQSLNSLNCASTVGAVGGAVSGSSDSSGSVAGGVGWNSSP